jgi:hypothetical protein
LTKYWGQTEAQQYFQYKNDFLAPGEWNQMRFNII